MDNSKEKWFFKPSTVILALLVLGPFGLPLVWLSPKFNTVNKVIITIVVVVLTVWLAKWTAATYNDLLTQLHELTGAEGL